VGHRGRGIITQSAFETQITEDIEKEKVLILRRGGAYEYLK